MTVYSPEEIRENRQKWVAALRSGEYPQGNGVLNRTVGHRWGPQGFCCLGVAMDLFHDGNTRVSGDKVKYINEAGDWEDSALTSSVCDKLGLVVTAPVVLIGGKNVGLITMNDGFKSSFLGIANAIEAQSAEWNGLSVGGQGYYDTIYNETLPEEYR